MTNLHTQTARSSVRLIRQALADLRAASADLSNEANFKELVSASDVLSSSIKRLSAYTGDAQQNDESPRQRVSVDINRVSRILQAAEAGNVCPSCGNLRT